jgi:hypothetical protein
MTKVTTGAFSMRLVLPSLAEMLYSSSSKAPPPDAPEQDLLNKLNALEVDFAGLSKFMFI